MLIKLIRNFSRSFSTTNDVSINHCNSMARFITFVLKLNFLTSSTCLLFQNVLNIEFFNLKNIKKKMHWIKKRGTAIWMQFWKTMIFLLHVYNIKTKDCDLRKNVFFNDEIHCNLYLFSQEESSRSLLIPLKKCG